MCSKDKVILPSLSNAQGALNAVQVCSTAQNIGRLNIGTTSTQAVAPNVTTATVTAPIASLLSQISIPSLLQSLATQVNNTTMSMQAPASRSVSMQAKPATVKSNEPFVLVMLNNRIKKCCGCDTLFRDSNGFAPQYILGHPERDWYPLDGKWLLGKLQNKYYHIRRSCIIHHCALYVFPEDMTTMKSELTTIPTSVKEVLFREFGV